ncbi:zinc-binding dehydrogenase [Comamonas sp.]|uniref:zinc-binding dehydrogenase n=1 Tax=Comamonas sp. TaxID=34028 RepID=UPI003A92803F
MFKPLLTDLFEHEAAGSIRIDIHKRYTLTDAARAHSDLKSHRTLGASVFTI